MANGVYGNHGDSVLPRVISEWNIAIEHVLNRHQAKADMLVSENRQSTEYARRQIVQVTKILLLQLLSTYAKYQTCNE